MNSRHDKCKYFGTDGIRGRVGTYPISADWILKLGWAVGSVLRESSGRGSVLIGKDTRISGYMFESALEAGLSSAGIDTYLLGPMPTPAIAYLTRALRAQAGIVISASHNPYYDNGVKFFSHEGTKLSDAWELLIEAQLEQPMITVDSDSLGRATRVADAQGRYIEFCKNTFPTHLTLKGVKIVVDCANGATYHVAPSVLRELGADIIELGVKPDGFNINDQCGSTHPAALAHAVIEAQADIGIALDGDGDRLILVDHTGTVVDGDEILYIIAKSYAEEKRLTGGVVGTVMSNLGLEIALEALAIPFIRTAVGDRYIIEMLKQNGWNLGGEASGHILCLDANTTGDGIVSALRVLAIMCLKDKTLFELKSGMIKFPQRLVNIRSDKQLDLNKMEIRDAVRKAEIRLGNKGRVLLRRSGTESVVRVMVEGYDLAEVDLVTDELVDVIRTVI